jgi:hypothetical protein
MGEDLLHYAQVETLGVGGNRVPELLGMATPAPPPIDPRDKPVRRRPNNGRKKRTNRNPPLAEPPWDILRSLNIPLPPHVGNLPYPPVNWRKGPRYLAWREGVFQRWGTVCHICGHPEAYTADHLVPLSVWPNQPYDPMLARPAHGVVQPDGSEGCPTCHVKCNSSRGNRALAVQLSTYQPAVRL